MQKLDVFFSFLFFIFLEVARIFVVPSVTYRTASFTNGMMRRSA